MGNQKVINSHLCRNISERNRDQQVAIKESKCKINLVNIHKSFKRRVSKGEYSPLFKFT